MARWNHDGIDTHETWWLGDEESPLATVSPEWNETRTIGRGKPDRWIARDATGNKIGEANSRREACGIIEAAKESP